MKKPAHVILRHIFYMKRKSFAPALCAAVLLCPLFAQSAQIKSPAGITVSLDEGEATYQVVYEPSGWTFAGQMSHVPIEIKTARGKDQIGTYAELSWSDGYLLRDSVRLYDAQPVALFTTSISQPTKNWPTDFPDFTTLPTLHHFSFFENAFAPPKFDLETNATPWLLFDDSAKAALISQIGRAHV